MEGHFLAGERLVERDLCEMTGVSRTSIREALRQLETEGLVESSPNRGIFVTKIDAEEVREIYTVRAVLEALAASEFASRGDDAQVAKLRAAFDRFESAVGQGEARAVLSTKEEFYEVLFEGASNRFLRATLSNVYARIMLLRSTSLAQPGRAAKSVAELRRIVDAIEKRKPDVAWTAAKAHVEHAARIVAAFAAANAEAGAT
jgi:DNA-binding GntR family transcriptional regulator